MKYTGLIAIVYLFLAGCEIKPATVPKKDTIKKPEAAMPDSLYASRRLHAFSDPAKLDTFKLDVSGSDFLTAKAKVQIISAAGVLIYLEEFNTADLAEYGIEKGDTDTIPPTEKEKAAHVQKRLKEFFDSGRFSSPAVKPGTVLQADRITDQALLTELRAKPKSISFHYVLGLDNGVYIAYSEKQGKAVLFYTGVPEKD